MGNERPEFELRLARVLSRHCVQWLSPLTHRGRLHGAGRLVPLGIENLAFRQLLVHILLNSHNQWITAGSPISYGCHFSGLQPR